MEDDVEKETTSESDEGVVVSDVIEDGPAEAAGLQKGDIIINSTPLGMYPKVDGCPTIPYDELDESNILFDLVYNPKTTLFMQKGLDQGALVKNGLDMLHGQAEAAWEIWNQ